MREDEHGAGASTIWYLRERRACHCRGCFTMLLVSGAAWRCYCLSGTRVNRARGTVLNKGFSAFIYVQYLLRPSIDTFKVPQ